MTTPAGWYPAPDGQPYQRYWDGRQWTADTAPLAPPPAPASPQPTRFITHERVRTSHTFHLLMTLLTLGAWGIFVWLPITVFNGLRRRRVVTRVKY